jgi:hypothetical protein
MSCRLLCSRNLLFGISMLTTPTLVVVGRAKSPPHPPPSVMCAPIPAWNRRRSSQRRSARSLLRHHERVSIGRGPAVSGTRHTATKGGGSGWHAYRLRHLYCRGRVQTMPACALLPMPTHICLWAARGPRRRRRVPRAVPLLCLVSRRAGAARGRPGGATPSSVRILLARCRRWGSASE